MATQNHAAAVAVKIKATRRWLFFRVSHALRSQILPLDDVADGCFLVSLGSAICSGVGVTNDVTGL